MTDPADTQPADPGWAPTYDGCPAVYTIGLEAFTPNLGDPILKHMTSVQRGVFELCLEAASSFPIGMCEGDRGHADRGEPHTLTVTWFEPVAEPDCAECSDTGQIAGQFCRCAAGQRLAGETALPALPDGTQALIDPTVLGGWSTPDEE